MPPYVPKKSECEVPDRQFPENIVGGTGLIIESGEPFWGTIPIYIVGIPWEYTTDSMNDVDILNKHTDHE